MEKATREAFFINQEEDDMAKVMKIKRVQLDPSMDRCEDLRDTLRQSIETESDIMNLHIANQTLTDEEFDNGYFENVIFEQCTFSKVTMERCSFRNVRFESCAFPNCDFSHSWFHQCEFTGTQLVGVNFGSSNFVDLILQKSALRYANFTSARFDRSSIMDCDLTDTFFAECTLGSFEVDQSRFVRTEFFHTPLKDVDFSTSELDGICVSDRGEELKGAVVNAYQAIELSKLLGLVVKEDV